MPRWFFALPEGFGDFELSDDFGSFALPGYNSFIELCSKMDYHEIKKRGDRYGYGD